MHDAIQNALVYGLSLVTDNTRRFDGLAASYDRHRPAYPAALFERIVARAPAETSRAVDVAAGTGISTRILLDTAPRAWEIAAVEPGLDMRRILRRRFQETARVKIVDGQAEALAFGDRTIGLITVCAAFHWFDTEKFLAEANRVLMPGGILAVIYNVRVAQPVIRAFDDFLFQDHPSMLQGITERSAEQEAILRSARGFEGFMQISHRWSQPMTVREIIDVWLTRSVAKPAMAKWGREQVETKLAEIYHTHAGEASIVLDYDALALTVSKSGR